MISALIQVGLKIVFLYSSVISYISAIFNTLILFTNFPDGMKHFLEIMFLAAIATLHVFRNPQDQQNTPPYCHQGASQLGEDFVDVHHPGILVHRAPGAGRTVQEVVLPWQTQGLPQFKKQPSKLMFWLILQYKNLFFKIRKN